MYFSQASARLAFLLAGALGRSPGVEHVCINKRASQFGDWDAHLRAAFRDFKRLQWARCPLLRPGKPPLHIDFSGHGIEVDEYDYRDHVPLADAYGGDEDSEEESDPDDGGFINDSYDDISGDSADDGATDDDMSDGGTSAESDESESDTSDDDDDDDDSTSGEDA